MSFSILEQTILKAKGLTAEQLDLLRWLQSRFAARTSAVPGKAAAWVRRARGSVRNPDGQSADEEAGYLE